MAAETPSVEQVTAALRQATLKLSEQTGQIVAEGRWFPFVATAGLFGAALAFVKLVEHLK